MQAIPEIKAFLAIAEKVNLVAGKLFQKIYNNIIEQDTDHVLAEAHEPPLTLGRSWLVCPQNEGYICLPPFCYYIHIRIWSPSENEDPVLSIIQEVGGWPKGSSTVMSEVIGAYIETITDNELDFACMVEERFEDKWDGEPAPEEIHRFSLTA